MTTPKQVCTSCGVSRAWTPEFFYWRVKDEKLNKRCIECQRRAAAESVERRRAEMGEEAWLELTRERVRKTRESRGMDLERAYNRAYKRALSRLAKEYPDEFEDYLTEELEIERAGTT